MKHPVSYRVWGFGLLSLVVVLTCSSRAYSQRRPEEQGTALRTEMYDMEKKAFANYEVEPEAQRVMAGLINRAVDTLDKRPTHEVHNRIVENFKNLLYTTAIYREREMEPHKPAMIMLLTVFAKDGKITVQSIGHALKRLCPLFPFC